MTFTRSTLELFAQLLSQVQLSATDPDIIEKAGVLVAAREELADALKDHPVVLPLQAVADES